MSEQDQFRELLEAYALGALDPKERAALEAHLATGCPDCAKGLEEARWVVSQLAYMAPAAEPSDMLRARIMRTVRAESVSPASSHPSIPYWMWAGVAALLLLSIYSAWDARQMQREVAEMNGREAAELQQREQLQKELTAVKYEARILTDPASKRIAIVPSDKSMPVLEAMWHAELGMVVTGQHVPVPKHSRVLQLWLIPKAPGGKPIPSRTFSPDADGKIGMMVTNPPEVMAQTKALAVTEEPAGGSLQPTSTPIWVGGLS